MKYILIVATIMNFALGQDIEFNPNYSEDGDSYSSPDNLTRTKTLSEKEWDAMLTTVSHNEYKLFKEKGIVTIGFAFGITKIPTLLSYEIYAEKCYNDSIHTYYSPMLTCIGLLDSVDDTTLINTGLVECWHDSTIYIEHITPTFEGFTEWIKATCIGGEVPDPQYPSHRNRRKK